MFEVVPFTTILQVFKNQLMARSADDRIGRKDERKKSTSRRRKRSKSRGEVNPKAQYRSESRSRTRHGRKRHRRRSTIREATVHPRERISTRRSRSDRIGKERNFKDHNDKGADRNTVASGAQTNEIQGTGKNHTMIDKSNEVPTSNEFNRNKNGTVNTTTPTPAIEPVIEKEKADFGLSGALQEDQTTGNVYKGVLLKFSEPEDAAMPNQKWRIYVFKEKKIIKTLYLHRQSAFIVGRDLRIADILTEHNSCSKQHAVIQFKIKKTPPKKGSLEPPLREIRPYIMDLQSTNGTILNGKKMDHSRYVELLDKDVVQFGESTREYVFMSPEAL